MRIIGFYLFTLVLFHCGCPILTAQEYSWHNYSIADGLPQTQVVSMMQDSEGFLWLGTKNGISIFDGIEFENYSSKDGLAFDHIRVIQEYKPGIVYIGSWGGLNVMENRRMKTIVRDLPDGLNFICIDDVGNLWFSDRTNGLMIWKDGVLVASHPVFSFLEPEEKLINMITTRKELTPVFSSDRGNVYIKLNQRYRKFTIGKRVDFLEGSDGGLYVVTEDSLFKYSETGFRSIFSLNGEFTILHVNNENNIYLNGFGFSGKLFHYLNGRLSMVSDQFNLIVRMILDDENNLWLGTDSGLWKLQSTGFRNYTRATGTPEYTWNVLQDRKGDYLFCSYNHQVKKLTIDGFIEIPSQILGSYPYSFYSGGIKTRSGDLLLTTSIGILTYDGFALDWFYRPLPYNTFLYIYDDRKYNQYLLASSNQGLIEIDDNHRTYIYDDREPWEHTELITSILRDKYDRIWISGKKGISIRENDTWRHLPDDQDSIPVGAISMLMDSAQNIWLGSNDGLYIYDYKKLQKIAAEVFSTQIGVLNVTNNNELVIGAINGLGLIDLGSFYRSGTATVRFFDRNSGFIGEECKHNSSFKDDDGNIWLCTSNCVVKVIPKELKTNPHPPRVYIKSITNAQEAMAWEEIIYGNEPKGSLVLKRNKNNLRFNYHAISLSAPLGVRYQTMLTGYDKQWSLETDERYRSYTNLPQGRYTFKVKARNSDGVWSAEAAEISFFIQPAWHELASVKIGGIVGAMLAMAGVGYFFSERKRKRIFRETQIEKNLARLQFRSLKGMIDPHFTFNAINSIASMMYRGEKDEAYGYFSKFSRLIRNLFEHAEHATRSLEAELEFVKNYLEIEKMRFGEKFDFEIRVDDSVDVNRDIPKLIIQIYVENAIKHGFMGRESGGLLEVIITTDQQSLHICIRDNGIGRKKAQTTRDGKQSLGKGTYIIRDYFDLLNKFNDPKIYSKTIDLQSADGATLGTEVRIAIPNDFKFAL